MSKNWLFIRDGLVIQVVTQEETPTSEQAIETYDTVAQDDSQTFKVGDSFTAELQLQFNKKLWQSYGWIPTDEQIAKSQTERSKKIRDILNGIM